MQREHHSCLLFIAGITDSFSSYESYYISGTSDTEYSSEGGSVEGFGSSDHFDVSEFSFFFFFICSVLKRFVMATVSVVLSFVKKKKVYVPLHLREFQTYVNSSR